MTPIRRQIPALRVQQWLPEWDQVIFDPKHRRRRPEPHFYILSMSASQLKALSGISRRSAQGGARRSDDIGIQRRHDVDRSAKIGQFIRHGYPWSELKLSQRQSLEYKELLKPGWLPTAIVVNILDPQDERREKHVHKDDLITISAENEGLVQIQIPKSFTGEGWTPRELHPIEVIDGQHRLWAFEDNINSNFELPVVAFHGLDISWQAYLFWTINITPKRINASLAFDLYPLLRTEDWLEKFEGPRIYRETRAQELTENLWAYPKSPWHNRINMLGESGLKGQVVTQAAWIRSLLATYVKPFEGQRVTIGGLFGAPIGTHETALPWTRSQQAAFLIFVWQDLRQKIAAQNADWAQILRGVIPASEKFDPAFVDKNTLLNTDQGVRGVLYVTNDLCFIEAETLGLANWTEDEVDPSPSDDAISRSISSLRRTKAARFISEINTALASFDWRTSAAPGLSKDEQIRKAALRGSGGYRELREQLLHVVAASEFQQASSAALRTLQALGYE